VGVKGIDMGAVLQVGWRAVRPVGVVMTVALPVCWGWGFDVARMCVWDALGVWVRECEVAPMRHLDLAGVAVDSCRLFTLRPCALQGCTKLC
jgi:hypothetical protein